MRNLVNVTEVAAKFGVHVETVRRWVRDGRIPYYMPTSKTLRFDLDSVEKVLNRSVRGKNND